MESNDKNSNVYKLKQEDKDYIFITTIVDDSIRLSCEDPSKKKFIHEFSISALKSLNKIFNKVETPNQAIEVFDKILKDHKVAVVEENQALKLVFYITEKEYIDKVEASLEDDAKEKKEIPVENVDNIGSYENLENYQTTVTTENYGEIQNYIPDSGYVENYGESNYITANYAETPTYTTDTGMIENYTSDQNLINELVKNPNEIITSTDYNYNVDTNNYIDANQYTGDIINTTTTTTTDYQNYPIIDTTTTTSYQQESYQIPETNINTYVDTSPIPYTTDTGFIQGETYNTTSDITYQTQDYTTTTNNYQTEEYSTTNYETQIQTPIESQPEYLTTTNTDYITETPINFPETTTTTTGEALYQTAMSTSVALPPETTTQSIDLPIKEEEPFDEKIKLENEISNLKAENDAYKQKLIELNGIQTEAAEAKVLKKQVDEIASLKAQIKELDSLKAKLSEIDLLKAELNKINSMKEKMEEYEQKEEESNLLKKKVEELEKSKNEYEQEIKSLRATQKSMTTSGLESKNIMFEEKAEQICVKGDIIHNTQELEMLTRKINKLNKKITLNLLYKATADSDKASAFHEKCDEAESSIVLIETDKGKRFGGFTTQCWKGECIEKKDPDAFIFSFDKMKTYDNIPDEDAIGCYPKFGPIFLGCQIRIYDNAFTKGGTTFEKGLNYHTEEDFELTGGDRVFNVKEIEVYEVITQ